MSIWKIALGVILGIILLRLLPYFIAGVIFIAVSALALLSVMFTPRKQIVINSERIN